jgi:hypothetical protein
MDSLSVTIVAACLEKLLSLFAATDHIDGAEAEMPAQTDNHFSKGAAGRSLQQPCSRRHLEDQARYDESSGRVYKERRRLVVRDVPGQGHHALRRYDDLLLPIPPRFIEYGNATADQQPTKQASPRLHDADPLRSRRGWQLGPMTVLAANQE